jgi:hypothetical protein
VTGRFGFALWIWRILAHLLPRVSRRQVAEPLTVDCREVGNGRGRLTLAYVGRGRILSVSVVITGHMGTPSQLNRQMLAPARPDVIAGTCKLGSLLAGTSPACLPRPHVGRGAGCGPAPAGARVSGRPIAPGADRSPVFRLAGSGVGR